MIPCSGLRSSQLAFCTVRGRPFDLFNKLYRIVYKSSVNASTFTTLCCRCFRSHVRRRILVSFARTGLGHGRQRSQGAYDIHRSVRGVKSVRPLVANRNALVPPVDVVAVAIGIIAIVRAAIGIAGIGSSGVGCTITVSPPAIAMAEASGTAVADRCRASLDRACNRGSVTTAGTDAAKRP